MFPMHRQAINNKRSASGSRPSYIKNNIAIRFQRWSFDTSITAFQVKKLAHENATASTLKCGQGVVLPAEAAANTHLLPLLIFFICLRPRYFSFLDSFFSFHILFQLFVVVGCHNIGALHDDHSDRAFDEEAWSQVVKYTASIFAQPTSTAVNQVIV